MLLNKFNWSSWTPPCTYLCLSLLISGTVTSFAVSHFQSLILTDRKSYFVKLQGMYDYFYDIMIQSSDDNWVHLLPPETLREHCRRHDRENVAPGARDKVWGNAHIFPVSHDFESSWTWDDFSDWQSIRSSGDAIIKCRTVQKDIELGKSEEYVNVPWDTGTWIH